MSRLETRRQTSPALVVFVEPSDTLVHVLDAVVTVFPSVPFDRDPEPHFRKLVLTADHTAIKETYAVHALAARRRPAR